MNRGQPLEMVAFDLYRKAWQQTRGVRPNSLAYLAGSESHREQLLLSLAEMVVNHHADDPAELEEQVRRFVKNRTFFEDAGDPVFDDRVSDDVEAIVELAMGVQRTVHDHAEAREPWHNQPSAPQMFG